MKSWITSYATGRHIPSQRTLMDSALRHRIDECRPWGREALEQTSLYKIHRAVLDMPRGVGYWLWKPFIIKETLREMDSGDVLVYSDAGIEIVADPFPLFELCLARSNILLFAGHYDDVGAPGPNLCGKWTKRDCFVFMDCDEPRYHQGQVLDASFMVLTKTAASVAFVREWLLYCSQSQLLTDDPNLCGLPNLQGFIEHRHDQSILSLLAMREGLEVFRHPSQYGNHLKLEPYREPGEWTGYPYGAKGLYHNSPYKTLLRHHRLRKDLRLDLHRTVPARPREVFAAWTGPEVLRKWAHLSGYTGASVAADVRVGGAYDLVLFEPPSQRPFHLKGVYLEVEPPARLVYSWRRQTRVTVEFHDRGAVTEVALRHEFLPSERIRQEHATVWNSFLDRLAEELGA